MNDPHTQPSPLSPLEYYNLIRTRIEHEDNLIIQRLSWLVASQSFLFTAYAITVSGLSAPQKAEIFAEQLQLLFRLVPIVGVLTCGLIYIGVIAAVKAIAVLRQGYRSRFGKEDADLPDIMTSTPIRRLGSAAPVLLPPVFVVVWLLLLAHGLR